MRLFIALCFDPQTRKHIQAVQERLRTLDASANYTLPDNLHLTLAFLGETERQNAVCSAMDAVPIEPLELCLNHIGRFRQRRGELWWLGGEAAPALLQVQRQLTSQLIEAGFSLEDRPFQPHLTLARGVTVPKNASLDAILGEPFTVQVEHMHLMRSERVRGVLTYTVLYTK